MVELSQNSWKSWSYYKIPESRGVIAKFLTVVTVSRNHESGEVFTKLPKVVALSQNWKWRTYNKTLESVAFTSKLMKVVEVSQKSWQWWRYPRVGVITKLLKEVKLPQTLESNEVITKFHSGQVVRLARRESRVRLPPAAHVRTSFPDIRTQCALSWKIVVSEWRSVIAVSLNVGGGVRLIKPANFTCARKHNTTMTRTDARRRVCAAMVPYRWATRGTPLRDFGLHTYTNGTQ